MRDTDLHIYLTRRPDPDIFSDLVSIFGFKYVKTVPNIGVEPCTDYYKWSLNPLSGSGLQLLFFHDLFSDDLNTGKFESFVIVCGDSQSSDTDLMMVDIFSILILNHYGGRIHNPQKIDKISTNFLLSGKSF